MNVLAEKMVRREPDKTGQAGGANATSAEQRTSWIDYGKVDRGIKIIPFDQTTQHAEKSGKLLAVASGPVVSE